MIIRVIVFLTALCLATVLAWPVYAQSPVKTPDLVPVTVTLTPAQYQMVVTALGELPAKQSFDTIAMLLNAEHIAQVTDKANKEKEKK